MALWRVRLREPSLRFVRQDFLRGPSGGEGYEMWIAMDEDGAVVNCGSRDGRVYGSDPGRSGMAQFAGAIGDFCGDRKNLRDRLPNLHYRDVGGPLRAGAVVNGGIDLE